MRNRPLLISGAVALLLILAVARVEIVYHLQLAPILTSHQAIQEHHITLYKKDMQTLNNRFPFALKKQGKSDAGPYLNARLNWTPKQNFDKNSTPKHLVPIVSEEARNELLRYNHDWLDHPSHFAPFQSDLSFFSKLSEYDHWNIEIQSPIDQLIQKDIFVPPSGLPVPDELDLIAASKLRLIIAMNETKLTAGLQDVRNLARLLMTTENSQMMTTGLAILEQERHAYWYFVSRDKMAREDWAPISPHLLTKTRRAFDATRGYLQIWTKPEIMDTVFLKGPLPIGICAALNDALPIQMSLRRYLEPHLPFEHSFKEGYKKLDQIVEKAKPQCRLLYMNSLLATDHFPARLPSVAYMTRAPYWRKLFGLRASLSEFSNFDAYEKLSVISHQTKIETEATPAPDEIVEPDTLDAKPLETLPAKDSTKL